MNMARNVVVLARTGIGHLLAILLAVGFVACLFFVGHSTDWRMPKFSALIGKGGQELDDWCSEHGVPESICIECAKKTQTSSNDVVWCRQHGVHGCPLCQPELAQTPLPPVVTDEDRQRTARALEFAPRVENNSRCKLHDRRIQFVNDEIIDRLGIEVAAARLGPVRESVSAPGEFEFDPTRVARLSSRSPGSVWRVAKNVGDTVKQGDVLALVDAADVGKAKSEFQQALVQLALKRQTLASLSASSGAVAGKQVQDAEAAIDESQVRLLQAEQALANLNMPVRADALTSLTPAEIAAQMQFLGLPLTLGQELVGRTGSNNLIAVAAPFDGEVIARTAAVGDMTDPLKPLFIVADTSRMWLTLKVRLEDVNKIKVGQAVRFEHAGHLGGDEGVVAWISPAADAKSRTVAVRVEMPNQPGKHHANTVGIGQVVLRDEPKALIVPSSAIHWDSDCHAVFVRDKNFDKPGGLKVFHVRNVRPGATYVGESGPVTEIAAGLLPGEFVATKNSGTLRTELLKNNLGAGCCGHDH
jgi:membrane fusion protein, heavy metal efflux system